MIALYPGTFDPITRGHADIARRAAKLFDRVIVAVAKNTGKKTLFSLAERMAMSRAVLDKNDKLEVRPFNSLVTTLAEEQGANVIIRGIRAVSDFDYEFQMAGMNRQLSQKVETVFLTPTESLAFISSSLVCEIASYQGDVGRFVDEPVQRALEQKFSPGTRPDQADIKGSSD